MGAIALVSDTYALSCLSVASALADTQKEKWNGFCKHRLDLHPLSNFITLAEIEGFIHEIMSTQDGDKQRDAGVNEGWWDAAVATPRTWWASGAPSTMKTHARQPYIPSLIISCEER